ncbi:Zn(2)-C6 fungal-type DNA-binding domain [Fusarium oxysporum f. sp. vasinfectum]|nr:Zn(2)-C6 fungal-type DNA-binding domain [Fusarium oxysporum f. sp. vasinfectum]
MAPYQPASGASDSSPAASINNAQGSAQQTPGGNANQAPQHKRVYQACIPCRRRKVRCDLGSVDNPHDPPCVRCRRESKDCYFSATRRKRKTDDDGSDQDDYITRNGRKRTNRNASPPPFIERRSYSNVPLTPGGSRGHPAVDRERRESTSSAHPAPPRPPPEDTGPYGYVPRSTSKPPKTEQPIDPELSRPELSSQPGYAEAIKAWQRFRFVRAGWFTALEAIEYIDYYYKYLSPLTPISPPTFSNPASHVTLLYEEPILTVTLLTIASRYRQMPGTGGHCRSHAIHEQLWMYLRGMIERCLWGQEAFGGGFCVPPSTSAIFDESQTSSTAPWRGLRKGSLRTLGTIESLMILTEWHPRALHFPPTEATDELVLPMEASFQAITAADEDPSKTLGTGFGGKRIESWLEPAWRSDRMCWMLLSTANGLAYELGVFDDIDELLRDDAITRPEYQEESYRQRAFRIKRLLLIYTTQLAGRLGWTNMAPAHLRRSDPALARFRPTSVDGTTPGTNPSSLSNHFNYVPDLELDDQIIHCWAGISNAMEMGNEKIFRSRKYTTQIIQNGKYISILKEFEPLLRDWWREFELFRLPEFIRHILTIEYQYVRIYINSLSLQAVVERCTNQAGATANSGHHGASAVNGHPQLSPQTMINYGKLPLGQLGGFTAHDQEYIREVVEGSRNLLRTVVEGLLPGDYLKHAPVRTYFRIISGAMFLLKTFALGAPRSDVRMSIELMDATVEALRNCVVDDVHLGIRFADLLESLTSRLRNRFIQAPTMQQASGRGQSPVPDGQTQNGDSVAANGDGNANWVGGHAQRLRDGLSGNAPAQAPTHEANNISATPFDLSTQNFPYPGQGSMGPSTPTVVDNAVANMDVSLFEDWNHQGNEMWYLPPGPAFFQNVENPSVAMGPEGVNVGGLDLLEYMAMDPSQFPGLDPSSGPPTSHA